MSISGLPATKFEVGETVEVKDMPGCTGTVLVIDIYERRYLLDPHPGAWSPYNWYSIRCKEGELQEVAACWVDEARLKKNKTRNSLRSGLRGKKGKRT